MKKILVLLISLVSISCFARNIDTQQTFFSQSNINAINCGHAVPLSDPNFCKSFKSIAYCHCHDEHGMPPTACNDMNRVFQIMTSTYGWPGACSPQAQKDVPQQECVDNWNFYRSHCK